MRYSNAAYITKTVILPDANNISSVRFNLRSPGVSIARKFFDSICCGALDQMGIDAAYNKKAPIIPDENNI